MGGEGVFLNKLNIGLIGSQVVDVGFGTSYVMTGESSMSVGVAPWFGGEGEVGVGRARVWVDPLGCPMGLGVKMEEVGVTCYVRRRNTRSHPLHALARWPVMPHPEWHAPLPTVAPRQFIPDGSSSPSPIRHTVQN